MSENTNKSGQQQPITPTPEASGGQGGERTFTQSELDRIVQDRLARDRASRPAADERERNLADREQKLIEREKAFEARQLNTALEQVLAEARPKSVKALMPFLDMSKVSLKDGKLTGLGEQLEALRKSPETLFLFEARSTGMSHQYSGELNVDGAIADAFKPKGRR